MTGLNTPQRVSVLPQPPLPARRPQITARSSLCWSVGPRQSPWPCLPPILDVSFNMMLSQLLHAQRYFGSFPFTAEHVTLQFMVWPSLSFLPFPSCPEDWELLGAGGSDDLYFNSRLQHSTWQRIFLKQEVFLNKRMDKVNLKFKFTKQIKLGISSSWETWNKKF